MFTHRNPACLAACTAISAAETSASYTVTFVESFLTSFIDMLTDDARQIFWHMVDGLEPSDPDRVFYATETLRALRHADRSGLAVADIIAQFGSLEAITLVRLLLWLTQDHGYVLVEAN